MIVYDVGTYVARFQVRDGVERGVGEKKFDCRIAEVVVKAGFILGRGQDGDAEALQVRERRQDCLGEGQIRVLERRTPFIE